MVSVVILHLIKCFTLSSLHQFFFSDSGKKDKFCCRYIKEGGDTNQCKRVKAAETSASHHRDTSVTSPQQSLIGRSEELSLVIGSLWKVCPPPASVLLLLVDRLVLRSLSVQAVVLNHEEDVEHHGEQTQTKLCRIAKNQPPLVCGETLQSVHSVVCSVLHYMSC